MESGERYWLMVEPHWERVSIYEGADVFLREFGATSEAARNLLVAHWCQSEVCNGGFHQFFWNSTGVLGPEAANAFDAIGMPGIAGIVRKALAFFGETYPRDEEERISILERYRDDHPDATDPFETLDDKFYELLDHEASGWLVAADLYAEEHGG